MLSFPVLIILETILTDAFLFFGNSRFSVTQYHQQQSVHQKIQNDGILPSIDNSFSHQSRKKKCIQPQFSYIFAEWWLFIKNMTISDNGDPHLLCMCMWQTQNRIKCWLPELHPFCLIIAIQRTEKHVKKYSKFSNSKQSHLYFQFCEVKSHFPNKFIGWKN